MLTLTEDLQISKSNLDEFKNTAIRVLEYIPAIIDEETEYHDYLICSSTIAGTRKRIRPFRKKLFIRSASVLNEEFKKYIEIIENLKKGNRDFGRTQFDIIDRTIYTIQQSIGIGLDLLVDPNSARKHVGNRFEELIRTLLGEMDIALKKVTLSIPYDTEEGQKFYRCETDVVISPHKKVKSDSQNIHEDEIVVTLKTTTKDRMPKIFIDKILMERFIGHPVKIVGISLNDVQRKDDKGTTKISYTFVSNLFMVYTNFLALLEGYYYVDVPRRALEAPFNQYIFPFSKFILEDIWRLLKP